MDNPSDPNREHRFQRRMQRRQFHNLPYAAPSVARNGELPLISVVLPVYNHARYLAASLDSTIEAASRYPLQVVVVNDGSTDDFSSAIAPFRGDERILIHEQSNGGIARALNAGFARAEGTFLTWTSADNRYRPGALDRLADYLLANPAVGLVYANVQLIDESGAAIAHATYRVADQLSNPQGILYLPPSADSLAEYADNFVNACFLYRNGIRHGVGDYDPSLHGCEDYDYWLRVSTLAPVTHLDSDDVLYEYRLHPETLTATLERPKLQDDVTQIVKAAQRRNERFEGKKRVSVLQPTRDSMRSAELTAINEAINSAMDSEGSFLREFQKRKSGRSVTNQLDLEITCALSKPQEQTLGVTLRPATALIPRITPFDRLLLGPFDPLFIGSEAPNIGALVPPPHDLPQILKRARGANFLAVDPHPQSLGVVAIFLETEHAPICDELRAKVVAPLLEESSGVTVTLVCSSVEERSVANAIFLATADAQRLRIVDISDEQGEDFYRALTFVLSAVDVILAPQLGADSIRALARVIGLSRVGCAAGLNVLRVEAGLPDLSEPAKQLRHIALQLPNVIWHGRGGIELQSALVRAMEPIDQRSCEQVLEEGSSRRFLQRLLASATPLAPISR